MGGCGVITRIKAYLSSTELGLTSQLELILAIFLLWAKYQLNFLILHINKESFVEILAIVEHRRRHLCIRKKVAVCMFSCVSLFLYVWLYVYVFVCLQFVSYISYLLVCLV